MARNELSAGDVVQARDEAYQIELRLSPGSLGAIYLARNSDGKPVVVKMPKTLGDDLDNARKERVMLEIDLLRKLKEDSQAKAKSDEIEQRLFSHVVHFIDDGYRGSEPFLVTEFLQGGRLKETYSSKPATLPSVLRYLEILLKTEEYLSSKGIVHRDINPSNLIMEPKRDLVLIDFGVAKWKSTQYAEVRAGTRLYSAPEQFDEPAKVGEASDMFAIASTMFYVLSAREPPEITQKTGNVKRLLEKTNRNLPSALLTLFETAMRPNPSDRFSSAEQMLDGVRKIKHDTGYYVLSIDGKSYDIFGTVDVGRNHNCAGECDSNVETLSVEIYDPNKHVSRHHLRIAVDDNRALLYDLGSRNGTAVCRKGESKFQLIGNVDQPQKVGFELQPGDIIALAYDSRLGPYKTAVFQKSKKD